MKLKISRQFSVGERLRYLLYRISPNTQHSVPDYLKKEYSFFFTLDRLGGSATREGGMNTLSFSVNSQPTQFVVRRNSSDIAVFEQIILNEEYKEIVSILKEFHISRLTVIDAGSNIGLTTIYLKRFFPDAEFVCVEPLSKNRRVFEKTISANSLADISIEKRGLWSKDCFLKERSFRDNKEWSFSLEETDKKDEGSIEAVSVGTLMNKFKLDRVGFFKMDVEGAEKNIFLEDANIGGWLPNIKVIAIEIHDEFDCRAAIEEKLKSFNFELRNSGELTIGINRSLQL
jgi:FkbM family methyltransferase